MTKRTVLYARVSGDDRENEGRNLKGQLEMGRTYAQEHGYTVVAELAEDDRGASGAEIDLPQLGKVREMAQAGEFDILVVREIDRLSRNLAKQLIVEQELQRAGIVIEYVLGEYPDTAEGRLNKHIRATIAEYEREKIAERMTRGRRNMARAGHVLVHGRAPYGYRLAEVDGKRSLEIFKPEAQVVRMVFDWYTAGNGQNGPLSLLGIAQKLGEMGIPTKGDTDETITKRTERGRWSASTVRRILKRETYAGTFYYGKTKNGENGTKIGNPRQTWIPVDVPAIVSRETWEAAQERLATNKRNAKRNTKHDYLLKSRVTCDSCGAMMCAKVSKGTYLYYFCWTAGGHPDAARTCDQKKWFRADWVDATVWRYVRGLFENPEVARRGLLEAQATSEEAARPLRDQVAITDDLLAEHRGKLARLLDLYLSGDFDRDILVQRKSDLEKTIAGLEHERGRLVARLEAQTLTGEQVENILTLWGKLGKGLDKAEGDLRKQRQFIEALRLTGRLAIEDGQPVIHTRCWLGVETLSIAYTTTRTLSLNTTISTIQIVG
jgi:site-specific DNA recombinase